jgi:hypothetical protein
LAQSDFSHAGAPPSLEHLSGTRAREPALRFGWLRVVGALTVIGMVLVGAGLLVQGLYWLASATVAVAGASLIVGFLSIRSAPASHYAALHAQSGWTALHAELARSRRYGRPFTLLSIPGDVWQPRGVRDAEKARLGLATALSVQELLRTTDRAWADDDVLYVLLSECDSTQGRAFVERAKARVPYLMPADRLRLAAFPEDGVTVGGLLQALGDGSLTPQESLIA